MNKSKINTYKINNNNKTNTKHEFNVKYERYKQNISKDRKLCLWKNCNINNQNQTNTTGAHNFKQFNNTAGWLSVFFVFFSNELIKHSHSQTTLPLPSRLENKKTQMQLFGNLDIRFVNYKNWKAFYYWKLLIFYLTNKETSKGWVCDNFPRQFHFFLGTFHEKHKFKYFKNLMVKVCKIWCNDVYMSILQCDIFWWKLIDRNCFNPIFNTKVVLRAYPLFAVSTVLHVIIGKQDIQIC
jgi:hypothetical protein